MDQLPGSLGQTLILASWSCRLDCGIQQLVSSAACNELLLFITACPTMSVNMCPNLQVAVTVLEPALLM